VKRGQVSVAIQKIVHVGNERRSLTAESDVRGAKIAERGDAGARAMMAGSPIAMSTGGRLKSLTGLPCGNGLAVASDERDFLWWNPELANTRLGQRRRGVSPKRKFNWLRAPAVMGCCSQREEFSFEAQGI